MSKHSRCPHAEWRAEGLGAHLWECSQLPFKRQDLAACQRVTECYRAGDTPANNGRLWLPGAAATKSAVNA
jgi:hypothetical protein